VVALIVESESVGCGLLRQPLCYKGYNSSHT
jgi:hypothetical protein